jgi:hypothetical protein
VVVSTAWTRSGLVVQIYFDSPDADLNAVRFEALRVRREEFEAALGEKPRWDGMEGRKAARIWLGSDYKDIEDRATWPLAIDWIMSVQTRLRNALDAVGGVNYLSALPGIDLDERASSVDVIPLATE